jgi:hypothetical protein
MAQNIGCLDPSIALRLFACPSKCPEEEEEEEEGNNQYRHRFCKPTQPKAATKR